MEPKRPVSQSTLERESKGPKVSAQGSWGSRETKGSFPWRAGWLQEGGECPRRRRVVSGQDECLQPKVGRQSREGRPDSEAPGNRGVNQPGLGLGTPECRDGAWLHHCQILDPRTMPGTWLGFTKCLQGE